MSTTLGGVRIVDMPDLGAFDDSSSIVGERAGSGRFGASALRKYIGGDINVQDFGATGDGTTDDAATIQQAIYAAAGYGRLRFPGTQKDGTAPAVYLIRASLLVPSYSHLIIEAPATIMIGAGTNATCFQIIANATSIAIDLYGTLDGNVTQQTIGLPPSGAITGQGNVPCSNILIRGFNSGVISNWKNWGFNLTQATNCEVNGVTFTNNGNSIEFAGLTHHIAVNTAGSSYTNSGATVLVTATPHGLVPGQTFTFYGITSDVQFSWLFGEYVAGPGTAGTTVNFTGPVNLNIPVFNPGASTSSVGTSSKCYNVGFVDCVVQDTQDLGILMYGGVVGGYVRNCEVTGCQGPFIFSDNAQPGSNWDCEILRLLFARQSRWRPDSYLQSVRHRQPPDAGIQQHQRQQHGRRHRDCCRRWRRGVR